MRESINLISLCVNYQCTRESEKTGDGQEHSAKDDQHLEEQRNQHRHPSCNIEYVSHGK